VRPRPPSLGLPRRWRRLRRKLRGPGRVPVWYDPSFRLPIPSLNARHGIEVRRSDFVAWYLTIDGWLHEDDLRSPPEIRYTDLARVHTAALLEGLTSGRAITQVFQVDAHEIRVDEVMRAIRRACGATLAGARLAVAHRQHSLSLLGGFHHAFPDKGGGLCPVNDIAAAVAVLRHEGFEGQVCILDLDAHPPDGTAACLAEDPRCWIGSLSGSDWGPVPGADETVLPPGTPDTAYLAELEGLLRRMPRAELAFVIAGGDVLAQDRFGRLGMTLGGARRRDLRVLHALRGVGTVWLPGGGYTAEAWRVLAGTGLALAGFGRRAIPEDCDPRDMRFDAIARRLDARRLGARAGQDGEGEEEDWLGARDLEVELGLRPAGEARVLGTYTREGIHYALDQYGILEQLERLGYRRFRVDTDRSGVGERIRLFGADGRGREHLLGETVVDRRAVDGAQVLFVHWLTLRHPIGTFGEARPRLPGQEVPGLGLSPEVVELLERMARRVGVDGVAWRPSFFHTAPPPGSGVRFVDDARQGRFEALFRDLGHLPPAVLSQALQQGRVLLDGRVYAWEPEMMVQWLGGRAAEEPGVDRERERVRFTIVPDEPGRTTPGAPVAPGTADGGGPPEADQPA
jgi:acetoin utilization deacetylase AcuC-like enzyme